MKNRRCAFLLAACVSLIVVISLPYMKCSIKGVESHWWIHYPSVGYSMKSSAERPKWVDEELKVTKSKCRMDPECLKFHRLLDKEWPPGKPRGAVVKFIGRRSIRAKVFRRFAEHFDKNFNDAFQYPLIVFHKVRINETDMQLMRLWMNIVFHKVRFNETDKQLIRSWTNSTVYFQSVELVTPSFVNVSHITEHCGGLLEFPLGYRHMCRFYARTMYEEPILANDKLEYVWRLDDYAVITKPIDYDIFQFMKTNKKRYGYVVNSLFSQDCLVGLNEAARHYLEKKSMKQNFAWQLPKVFYNPFEIAEMNLWRSAGYADFIHYIDLTGGIYNYRWSDAPIKTIAVSILVSQNDTHRFTDIGFRHRFHENIGEDFDWQGKSNTTTLVINERKFI